MAERKWLSRITRRDFLEGVLLGAGAVALGPLACRGARPRPGPGSHSAFSGERFRTCHALLAADGLPSAVREPGEVGVAIVGAGLSGLAAAWALTRHGVDDFALFDKEDVCGGHARALSLGDQRAAAGAAYSLTPWGELLTDLYRGIDIVPDSSTEVGPQFLVPEPANRAFAGGRWIDDAWGEGMDELPSPAGVRRDLKALRSAIRAFGSMETKDGRLAFDVPADASTTDERVRALDRMSFADWVQSLGLSSEATRFFDPYCRSALGMRAGEVSAWSAVGFLQAEWEPTLTRPGGTAFIAERLGARLGSARQRLGRTVVRVERDGDGALLTYAGADGELRSVRARRVIVAAPKYVARRIIAGAPAAQREAWERFAYRPYIVANFRVRDLDSGLGYDNWLQRGPDDGGEARLVTDVIVADAQSRHGRAGRGVLTAYCPVLAPFARGDVLNDPFETWVERIVSSIGVALPRLRDEVEGVDLFRWGHALIESPPGFVFGEARVNATRAFGPIYFAHTDLDGVPAVESAIAQGVRAADEVARGLGKAG